MSDGIYSALSGALAQERTLAVVANNVANATTTGFQGDKVVFSEIVAQNQVGSPAPSAQRFVNIDRIGIDSSTGGMAQTNGSYDVALQGEGYFAVEGTGGERYTRAGSFVADGDGVLRTHSGLRVLGEGGAPNVPGVELSIPSGTKNLSISPDGTLQADGQSIGKLKIVKFAGDDPLMKEGLTLLATQNGAQPMAADGTTVAQGFLETSNVNAVAGMQDLITVSRSFDAFQKVIETFRDLDQRTVRDIAGKG